MTKFRILSAAALLSLAFATPVFAQAAIQEPGAFAFYYPNNDVLNGGRPTPAARANALTPEIFGGGGPVWTAARLARGTVRLIRLPGRSSDMTAAGTSASNNTNL